MKILFAGESWISTTTHIKGFDTFTTTVYEQGADKLIGALKAQGHDVTYLNNEAAPGEFPFTSSELSRYGAVMLSDIGSNSLLLSQDTFAHGVTKPNRCESIREYVKKGGGFCMIGGYMSFSGIEAKARYNMTPVADILPVQMLDCDDRVECPQGAAPEVLMPKHPILEGIGGVWPKLLGYNRTIAKKNARVIAAIEGDPLVALGLYGKGRTAVFTSDCSPHWGTKEFQDWACYGRLWNNIVDWLTEHTAGEELEGKKAKKKENQHGDEGL